MATSARIQILLIEDNPGDAYLIRDALEVNSAGANFELIWANRLAKGLEHLSTTIYDLVLLDLGLPDSTGLGTLQRLHAHAPELPIVILTGIADEALAVQAVQAGAQDCLTKGQVDGLTLGRVIRYAIERKKTESALERRSRELSALYDTSLEISSQQNLRTLLEAIVERSVRLIGTKMGAIYLLQPDEEFLLLSVTCHMPVEYTGRILRRGEGVSGRVLETGKALTIEDYSVWEGRSEIFEKSSFRRVLGVPLKVGEKIIGVINVSDDQRVGQFTMDDIRLVSLFADQAAIAIEKARLFETVQRHGRNMARLNEITRAAFTSSDVQSMLNSLAKNFCQLLQGERVYITLYAELEDRVTPTAAFGPGSEGYSKIEPNAGENSLSRSILMEGRTLALDDLDSFPLVDLRLYQQLPDRSLLGVPMIVDGHKLGAVLIGYNQKRHFSAEEISLAEQATAQIALAITRAQLLESEHQQRLELARSNALIAALSQVVGHLEAAAEPRQIMQTLGIELKKLGVTMVIGLMEPGSESIILEHHTIESASLHKVEKLLGVQISGYSLPTTNWVFKNLLVDKRPLFLENPFKLVPQILPNIPKGILKLAVNLAGINQVTHAICLPLINKDKVVGALMTWGHDLRQGDLAAYSIFAQQVASAIENARLYMHISQIAIKDELTGLYNRRGFITLADQQMKLAGRGNHLLQLIFLDVDFMKQINDTFGHLEGDIALMNTATLLRRTFRTSDIIGRMAGDEFAILATSSPDKTPAWIEMRLKTQLAEFNHANSTGRYELSVSIGSVFWSPDAPISLDEMLARADENMYEQKRIKKEKQGSNLQIHAA